MIRHPSVVDNFVFVKLFCDDQRSMGWSADGRELCSIINIASCSPRQIVLPFFTLAEVVHDWTRAKWDAFYTEYCAVRSDMCLPVYLMKGLLGFFFARHECVENRFGFYEEELQLEASANKDDAQPGEKVRYFLLTKKDYANRFSTNCHKGLFSRRVARCGCGLDDVPSYSSTLATDAELDATHSHFIMSARKDFDGE